MKKQLDFLCESIGVSISLLSPSIGEVLTLIKDMSIYESNLSIKIIPMPEVGSIELTIESKSGYFLPLLQYLTYDDHKVRTLYNPERGNAKVEVGGNLWSNIILTQDFSLIEKIISDFLLTNDISMEIMPTHNSDLYL